MPHRRGLRHCCRSVSEQGHTHVLCPGTPSPLCGRVPLHSLWKLATLTSPLLIVDGSGGLSKPATWAFVKTLNSVPESLVSFPITDGGRALQQGAGAADGGGGQGRAAAGAAGCWKQSPEGHRRRGAAGGPCRRRRRHPAQGRRQGGCTVKLLSWEVVQHTVGSIGHCPQVCTAVTASSCAGPPARWPHWPAVALGDCQNYAGYTAAAQPTCRRQAGCISCAGCCLKDPSGSCVADFRSARGVVPNAHS